MKILKFMKIMKILKFMKILKIMKILKFMKIYVPSLDSFPPLLMLESSGDVVGEEGRCGRGDTLTEEISFLWHSSLKSLSKSPVAEYVSRIKERVIQ